MSIWSGETLGKRLPTLIKPFDPARIDCAAYTLALGHEAYVTSDQRLEGSPRAGVKIELDPGAQFRIPPGQFAFLLTEEEITVPKSAIALISIRASYKFKGLVNVSGFHVDPGWNGRLIFSVYNAGPASVVLSRGAPAFLIWYVNLDQETAFAKDGEPRFDRLPDGLLNNMGGNVFSPMVLSQEITELRQASADLREELTERATNLRVELAALKSEYEFHKRFFWVIVGVVLVALARPFLASLVFGDAQEPVSEKKKTNIETTVPSTTPAARSAVGAGSTQGTSERREKSKKTSPGSIESRKAPLEVPAH